MNAVCTLLDGNPITETMARVNWLFERWYSNEICAIKINRQSRSMRGHKPYGPRKAKRK